MTSVFGICLIKDVFCASMIRHNLSTMLHIFVANGVVDLVGNLVVASQRMYRALTYFDPPLTHFDPAT